MASRRPESELHGALGEFGRCAKKLSVARLEEVDTVLKAVGTPEQLNDADKRRDLAVRVFEALRSIVAEIEDPVDRRIAQAVLATEPEFYDKLVGKRLAYVRENDRGFSDEQYYDKRRRVVGDIEEALAGVMGIGAAPRLSGESNPHKGRREAPTNSEDGTGDHARAHTATIERTVTQPDSLTRAGRRRLILAGVVAAILVLLVIAGVAVLTRHYQPARTWNGMTAAELERRYDGKLPGGQDGTESHCSDGDLPPSLVVDRATAPPVMGSEGGPVGNVQLRKSQVCPTVVWARVLWKGDERERYQIPPGWTLHVVMHRPETKSSFDETEPSTASQIPYALSSMIASARGCVYAEAYFTNGDLATASVSTSCVRT
jgi:hypothetical protein